ncbi:MAG TPA: response regulator [Phycisphaerae bacterium]|nr:response regulator [Phycisphaerae bacterium]HRY68578.1 response regulator [Phycisphaerae bacterium]HSA25627.1 response regulator [Phycisphaerae bacterium]
MPASILVVDDMVDNVRLLNGLLDARGYEMRSATDGAQALASASAEPPDLILLDIRMPGLDGYEVCRRLKADPATADIPVVFLSAAKEPLDKIEAFAAGGVDYVTKPFEAEEVLARVSTHVALSRLRRELKQANEGLEEKVTARTAELAAANERLRREIADRIRVEQERTSLQEMLHQAQKMEAVGQLAGGVAHDFSNLLTVILGNIDIVLDRLPDQPVVRDAAAVIQDAAEQAVNVTRSLLAFARRLPCDRKKVCLQEVIKSSCKMLHRLLPSGIQVLVDTPPQPLWIDADSTQIQQIILNLAINARDAMADGGTLQLSALSDEPSPAPGSPGTRVQPPRACLVVADTGTGIPEEILPRLFEPFFSTKPRGQGTGLGLSIVHGIVENHGGAIEVQSEVGRGAVFKVWFPRIEAPTPKELAGPVPAAARGSGEVILVAEDDPFVRDTFSSVLHQLGYEVISVADGSALLDQWQADQARIRMVITDNEMPGRSGIDCSRVLRGQGATIPIVITTGTLDDDAEFRADERTVLVRKPFRMDELALLVERLLKLTDSREPSPAET